MRISSLCFLDKAGLTITFGQGKGVVRKPDGTLVLSGKGTNGMYLLENAETVLHIPLAMASLCPLGTMASSPVTLQSPDD